MSIQELDGGREPISYKLFRTMRDVERAAAGQDIELPPFVLPLVTFATEKSPARIITRRGKYEVHSSLHGFDTREQPGIVQEVRALDWGSEKEMIACLRIFREREVYSHLYDPPTTIDEMVAFAKTEETENRRGVMVAIGPEGIPIGTFGWSDSKQDHWRTNWWRLMAVDPQYQRSGVGITMISEALRILYTSPTRTGLPRWLINTGYIDGIGGSTHIATLSARAGFRQIGHSSQQAIVFPYERLEERGYLGRETDAIADLVKRFGPFGTELLLRSLARDTVENQIDRNQWVGLVLEGVYPTVRAVPINHT